MEDTPGVVVMRDIDMVCTRGPVSVVLIVDLYSKTVSCS